MLADDALDRGDLEIRRALAGGLYLPIHSARLVLLLPTK
jgi:hypothetical protein